MNLRARAQSEVKQLRHGLKPYRRGTTTLRREIGVWRAMELPPLPRSARVAGSVWAVGLVRNEGDVIEAAVRHLVAQGVDHVLVADNLSTDGTHEVLRRLEGTDARVHVAIDHEPAFHQASKTTRLAQAAWRAGADWIVPFDADEFWFAEGGTLADHLRRTTANSVRALVHNAVPATGDLPLIRTSTLLLESVPQSLEKRAVRSHRWLRLQRGNHGVDRTGPVSDGLFVVHVPYRGPRQLGRKHAPEALIDRLASAEPHHAVQYRRGDELDAAGVPGAWETVRAGLPKPRLNWTPCGDRTAVQPLAWSSWALDGSGSAGR